MVIYLYMRITLMTLGILASCINEIDKLLYEKNESTSTFQYRFLVVVFIQ